MSNWDNDDETLHNIWDDDMDNIAPVPESSYERLSPRQRELYARARRKLFRWVLDEGKDPEAGEGYAKTSLPALSSRLDRFYRWTWDEEGEFLRHLNPVHADEYVRERLRKEDWSDNAKRKTVNALDVLMRWEEYTDWEPPNTWHDETSQNVTDYLSEKELRAVKKVSVENYGDIPHPSNLDPVEEDEWRGTLANLLNVPKEDITVEDFERERSYKIASLVHVSADVGLRPIEVRRLTLDNMRVPDEGPGTMVISQEESSKNSDNWECYLSEDTTDYLRYWLDQRENIDLYNHCEHCAESEEEIENSEVDCIHLWLTREGNPYDRVSLRRLMMEMMGYAGIDTETRETGWYMLRRGTATKIANADESTLETVMQQLRIKRTETAARYVHEDGDHIRGILDD